MPLGRGSDAYSCNGMAALAIKYEVTPCPFCRQLTPPMSLKTQIRLGVFLMLGLLLGLGSYVVFTIRQLEFEAPAVQQANARLAQHAVYLF